MTIRSFTTASLWVPMLIELGFQHSLATTIGRYNIIKPYEELIDFMLPILFYSYLFEKQNTYVYFDEFAWLPMPYEDIINLANYANTLPTLMTDKLEINVNQGTIKLIV